MPKKLPDRGGVVKVGDGRGFVVEHWTSTAGLPKPRPPLKLVPFVQDHRLVFTAAHCLPKLPPAISFPDPDLRTYRNLLGSLDGPTKNIWIECLFVDPVADIAVLGCPDDQRFYDEAVAYDTFVESVTPIPIGTARSGKGWILALDGEKWIQTNVCVNRFLYGISLSIGPTEAGMSGSPILNRDAKAIGIVAIGEATIKDGVKHDLEENGPQPMLERDLPAWLKDEIYAAKGGT